MRRTPSLKHEVNESVQALVGFVIVALVIAGIGGTIYRVLAPGGWLSQAFGQGTWSGVGALAGVIFFTVVLWSGRSAEAMRFQQRIATLAIWLFAGAGAVYLMKYLSSTGA